MIVKERLKYHTMNLHDREETIETICSECNNNIGELEDFLNHIEIKHSEDCDECSLSFIDEICLNIHVVSVGRTLEMLK